MGGSELVALALQRVARLRSDEKLLALGLARDESSFASLSLGELEALAGRSLGGMRWNPRELLAQAESDAAYLLRVGVRRVGLGEPGYPAALAETYRPPFGLYVRGASLPPAVPCAAIVGTRTPTGRGLDAAARLAEDLAAAGIPVVSGLARGIDAAAHRGALAGGGATCAVLPCGIDAVYPPANRGLASDILERGGLLVTEYPPGTGVHRFRFPERNRIIAGLARACVVVEAPAGSGALITADHALQEGRDVWVVEDCRGGPRSAGSDALAAQGAPSLAGAADLLADWGRSPRPGATSGRRAREETAAGAESDER